MNMATFAQTIPEPSRPLASHWKLLKEELIPYPGRAALVARMVMAATLAMLITMTFRLPYGAYCAIYSLAISRESTQITVKAALTRIVSYAIGASYVLIGGTFFVDDPLLRLLWVIGSMFMAFYAISAMTNNGAATTIAYLIVITVPLWDEHISGELRVEGTLWAVFALSIGSAVAVVVEVLFEAIRPWNELLRSLADRLASVEAVLACYGKDVPVDQETAKKVTHLAMLGTSRLRHILRNSNYPRQYLEQMGAVVALVGRQVDIAASFMHIGIRVSGDDRQRLLSLVRSISTIRADLLSGRVPSAISLNDRRGSSSRVPLLKEMEKTVSLIPEAFSGGPSVRDLGLSESNERGSSTFLVADAFSNLDHLRFGLKG